MTIKTEGRHLVELLTRLGSEYRHFKQEHDREPVDHPTRRVLEGKIRRLGERFEQILSEWIQDEELRRQWIQYRQGDGPPPDGPSIATPPEFKGLTDAGSQVEIRPTEDGGHDILVDGRIESHESVPWYLDPDLIEPIEIGARTCRETFDAPPEAVQALAAFLTTPEAEPPWPWARALLADGLIDYNFSLTPRGQRRLGKHAPQAAEGAARTAFGILAADAVRARLFVLQTSDGENVPTLAPLVEVFQTTNPEQRARDSQVFSDTRPGLRREAPQGPRHGVSDRREGYRDDVQRRFAAQIIADAERIWRANGVTHVVVAASPEMLGFLRPAMTHPEQKPWSVRELARDLSRLSAPALHDALADDGLLPPRGRRPPTRPVPGLPI